MGYMESSRTCTVCGAPLSAAAAEGLCPRCLLRAGMVATEATQPGGEVNDELIYSAKLAELFPQLEILELIGRGGMGAVYKARQPALDRLVALKILPAGAASDPGFAERFNREARALARLAHPNIVAVYDFGQVSGLHYFIMEFVDGRNLRQIEQTARLSPRHALQIIPQICEALQFAHDEGVVHRDIKPENVLLDKRGRVKIADFGLAKILGLEPKDLRLTGVRDIVGTPHYMAPEQVEHPQSVDHRADIYSLGVVFYEMLTGELPLGKFAPPSRKVQVDVRLDEVVLHALEKERELRYQHASEVKTDVETISGSPEQHPEPGEARQIDAPVISHKSITPKFWKTAWGLLAIAVSLLLLAGAGIAFVANSKPQALRANSTYVPDFSVLGLVSDALTGQPVASARVADKEYGAKADRAPQEAWTDTNGHYQLRTWNEEHSLAASAPGYKTKLAVLTTGTSGSNEQVQLDFQLEPLHTPSPVGIDPPAPVPPVVVRTIPESGASDVDPELSELQVTFSTPMLPGSWSWSSCGEGNFPETTRPIRYLPDGRTCAMPVKLMPGHVYATWLNSAKFTGFQDREGHPAVPYLLVFRTRNSAGP